MQAERRSHGFVTHEAEDLLACCGFQQGHQDGRGARTREKAQGPAAPAREGARQLGASSFWRLRKPDRPARGGCPRCPRAHR